MRAVTRVRVQTVTCGRASPRGETESLLGCAEEAPAAGVVGVLAEHLDAAGHEERRLLRRTLPASARAPRANNACLDAAAPARRPDASMCETAGTIRGGPRCRPGGRRRSRCRRGWKDPARRRSCAPRGTGADRAAPAAPHRQLTLASRGERHAPARRPRDDVSNRQQFMLRYTSLPNAARVAGSGSRRCRASIRRRQSSHRELADTIPHVPSRNHRVALEGDEARAIQRPQAR